MEEVETASLPEPTGNWTRLSSSRLLQKIKRISGEDIIQYYLYKEKERMLESGA